MTLDKRVAQLRFLVSNWHLPRGAYLYKDLQSSASSFLSSVAVAAWALQPTPHAQGGRVLVSNDP